MSQMTRINVIDRNGSPHTLESNGHATLMEVLRDEGLGTEGTCGGICACGTCHVYIRNTATLPAADEDEQDMLAALSDVVAVTDASRLACQIRFDTLGDSLDVEVAPQL